VSREAAAVHQSNASAWNQTSRWYEQRAEELRETPGHGGSTLHVQERKLLELLPPLNSWCELAVHLQCASGFDTISLANLGAHRAVGVDISPELVRVAGTLSKRLDASATFQCADVLEFTECDGQADLVYTGKGSVHWMFDLAGWAARIAAILRPGGWFLLFDFHSMMWLFRDGRNSLEVNPVSYFAPVISYRDWASGHFPGLEPDAAPDGEVKQLRPWPPSAVIQSLIQAGLEIAIFHEYPDSLIEDWTAYPHASMAERSRIASTYAVMARKPGGTA
jgi:SAM-dependent methyltransferase